MVRLYDIMFHLSLGGSVAYGYHSRIHGLLKIYIKLFFFKFFVDIPYELLKAKKRETNGYKINR